VEIVGTILLLVLIVLLPLTCFSGQLIYAKRTGEREYGSGAGEYVREFRKKWIDGQNSEGEHLLGSGDIQSLATWETVSKLCIRRVWCPSAKRLFCFSPRCSLCVS
jgi:hypothetical protein